MYRLLVFMNLFDIVGGWIYKAIFTKEMQMKTYTLKDTDVKKKWILVDAEGVVLGRLASQIASILRGKTNPAFTAHVDCGDNVIVINAEKVKVTGKKLVDHIFHYHTGFAGGVKSRSIGQRLDSDRPEQVVEKAVQRMLPRGPLGRQQFGNLRVYKGAEHPHEGQSPEILDIAARNPKNKRVA